MSYNIVTIPPFDRQLKRLIKKYPSLKKEVAQLGEQLTEDPALGTGLGNDCYKIRLAIASKGKGKSGGARVITHDLRESISCTPKFLPQRHQDTKTLSFFDYFPLNSKNAFLCVLVP